MKESPIAVQAVGVSHTNNDLENIAYLTLFYPDQKIAILIVHGFSCQIRQMLIGGDEKMILFNDLETTEKIKIYDKGYKVIPEQERDKFWWIIEWGIL